MKYVAQLAIAISGTPPITFKDIDVQTQFAFYTGIWNGLVEEAGGLIDAGVLLSGYMINVEEARAFDAAIDQLNLEVIWKQFVEAHGIDKEKGVNKYVLAHQLGKDVVAVGSMFIGVGEITAATKISTVLSKFKGVIKVGNVLSARKLSKIIGELRKIEGMNAVKLNTLRNTLAKADLTDGQRLALLEKAKTLDGDAPKFVADFAENADALAKLAKELGLVKAWKAIDVHPQLRVDIDVLESLSKALDDDYLKTLNLDQVITNKWTKHGFGCPKCTNGGKPWINELIDQLEHFKQFKDVEGYQTVLDQLLDQGKTQAIGSHWVMKYTKQKSLSPTKFEDFVDEATGDFSADIIANGKFIECKSWGSKAPGMSNVPNQMINYFNTQNSLTKFQFQFDPERWVPSPSDLNQALKANTNLFDTNKWSNYQQMFQFTNAQVAPNDINGLIDFITANKFSDIINP